MARDIPLDSHEKCATFTLLAGFEIMHGFKTISNILNMVFMILSVFVQYLGRHFQTAHRIDANNMPLDRYGNYEMFTLLSDFEIMHGFKAISDILNAVFADLSFFVLYFERHFQTVRQIDETDMPFERYRKFATFLFLANFRNFLRFKNSSENKQFCSKSSGQFSCNYFQTAYRNVTNDTALERY